MPLLSTSERLDLYRRGLLPMPEAVCPCCGGSAFGVTLGDRRGMCLKCWHLTPEGVAEKRRKCRQRVSETRARQRANLEAWRARSHDLS